MDGKLIFEDYTTLKCEINILRCVLVYELSVVVNINNYNQIIKQFPLMSNTVTYKHKQKAMYITNDGLVYSFYGFFIKDFSYDNYYITMTCSIDYFDFDCDCDCDLTRKIRMKKLERILK